MTTTLQRHLDAATLMSFAAGALAEPLSAAVSAHVSMCRHCRDELADMALIGVALLREGSASAPVRAPALPKEAPAAPRTGAGAGAGFERLLARKYGVALDTVPWTRLAPGIWQHRLPLSEGVDGELYLVKLSPGVRLPRHGHAGTELTVVLAGAFADASGVYRRGEVQEVDAEVEHQPVGDAEEGCICLIAAEMRGSDTEN